MSGHWRVKLYQLDEEGSWVDKGTGSVCCQRGQSGATSIVVHSEHDDSVVLESPIAYDDRYERQNGRISV
jgi:hypothetical protein